MEGKQGDNTLDAPKTTSTDDDQRFVTEWSLNRYEPIPGCPSLELQTSL